MGRTRMGMRSITMIHLIRESQDCSKAPSCINRPFDDPLGVMELVKNVDGSHPPHSKPGAPF